MNQEAYPNIEKVVRAIDVLLGWTITIFKVWLLVFVAVVLVVVLL